MIFGNMRAIIIVIPVCSTFLFSSPFAQTKFHRLLFSFVSQFLWADVQAHFHIHVLDCAWVYILLHCHMWLRTVERVEKWS